MADEFEHRPTVTGTTLQRVVDWEATNVHRFDSQAIGDLMYAPSAAQLGRLGIGGTAGMALTVSAGGIPQWGGDVYIGANKILTTDLLLRQGDANTFYIRNSADDTFKYLYLSRLYFLSGLFCNTNASTLDASANDDDYFTFRAKDNGAAIAEVARLQGAADPYFSMGGTQEFKFYESGYADFGMTYIGDTSNVDMTLGLTINQGAADDEILSFKSSDVAHGATSLTETDTYGAVKKAENASGGLVLQGFKSAVGVAGYAFNLQGYLAENVDTTKSTAGISIIYFYAAQTSGANIADVVADGNIFSIGARVGAANLTQLILDEDGDLWLNASGKGLTFASSAASALVADEVSLGGVDLAPGERSLAISQENPVVVAAAGASDNYLPVQINGATFKLLLHS